MCLRGQLTLNQVVYRCFTSTDILYLTFFFLLHHMACGISVLRPGTEVGVLTTGPPGNSFLLLLEDLCSIRFHQRFKLKDESLIENCRVIARGGGIFLRSLKYLRKGDSGFTVMCSHRMM